MVDEPYDHLRAAADHFDDALTELRRADEKLDADELEESTAGELVSLTQQLANTTRNFATNIEVSREIDEGEESDG